MLKTKITEMLGIKYPLIAGTMMNISYPEFVAACSNAGGLGILASVIYKKKSDLREGIQKIKSLTDKPFAINVNLFPMLKPVNLRKWIQIMIDEGVPIIETSGHEAPEKYVSMMKDAGITWIHKCAGVRYAKKGAKLGADIIEIVGWENGGATGKYDIGSLVLTPTVVDAVNVPVVAGGGVADGRGLLAMMALGAEGVIMGTRMMATKECPIHDNLKQVLIEKQEIDTTLVMRSLHSTHRVWNNAAAQKILELEKKGASDIEIFEMAAGSKALEMYQEGHLDVGMVSCSQNMSLIKDIPTVQELFDRIMKEADDILNRLSKQRND
jgi:NADH:quinone reductase (non-electrogenic)